MKKVIIVAVLAVIVGLLVHHFTKPKMLGNPEIQRGTLTENVLTENIETENIITWDNGNIKSWT